MPSKIIEDGGTVRVRLDMMDSTQRAVARHGEHTSKVRVTDAFGRPAGQRSGSVFAAADCAAVKVTDKQKKLIADAYAEHDRAESNRWRMGKAKDACTPPGGDESYEDFMDRCGDEMDDAACQAMWDQRDFTLDARARAYADADAADENAWRKGKP